METTGEAVQANDKKRQHDGQEQDSNKKPRSEKTNTIPIMRGRFKGRWLTKHSSLLKRSDEASGIMVSCGISSETRALGQVQTCLETYIPLLFPNHQLTWERFEGDLDVEDLDADEKDKEEEPVPEEARKEKRIQAVDAACGGLIFYRFRIDVKPTTFVTKLIQHFSSLPDEERQRAMSKIRHATRWIPLDYICPAITERIAKSFERLCSECLTSPDLANKKIAIVTEIRNNILINKEQIIQTIAPLIPKQFKVDLKHPDLVIFVTVFKSVCGMSVLHDYYQMKKFNLTALFEPKKSK